MPMDVLMILESGNFRLWWWRLSYFERRTGSF